MPEVHMQNEKTQTMPQSWFTENMRAMYNDDDDDNDNDDDQPQNCTADYGKSKIIGTAAIFFLSKVMWKQWHLMYHCVSA